MDSDADNLIYNFRLILMKGWDSDEYDNNNLQRSAFEERLQDNPEYIKCNERSRHCSSAFIIRRQGTGHCIPADSKRRSF